MDMREGSAAADNPSDVIKWTRPDEQRWPLLAEEAERWQVLQTVTSQQVPLPHWLALQVYSSDIYPNL